MGTDRVIDMSEYKMCNKMSSRIDLILEEYYWRRLELHNSANKTDAKNTIDQASLEIEKAIQLNIEMVEDEKRN